MAEAMKKRDTAMAKVQTMKDRKRQREEEIKRKNDEE